MPQPYRSFTVQPRDGGKLMARPSSDSVSAADYSRKLDLRRVLDVEVRREGYVPFWPNTDAPLGTQPYPTGISLKKISGIAQGNSDASGILSLLYSSIYSAKFTSTGLDGNRLAGGGGQAIIPQDTSFTVAGWALLANRSAESYIASIWIGGGNECWFFGVKYWDAIPNRFYGALNNQNGSLQSIVYGPSITLDNNTWHYVAFVHEQAARIRLYTDGQEAEVPHVLGSRSTSEPVTLGSRGLAGTVGFNGRLDMVGIWNRALSKAELDVLYADIHPYPALSTAQKVSLLGYYDFEDRTLAMATHVVPQYQYLVNLGINSHGIAAFNMTNIDHSLGGVTVVPFVESAAGALVV